MTEWFIGLTTTGCIFLYLSHKNQNWLKKSVKNLYWKWLGGLLLFTGLITALTYLPINSAIFSWLAVIILVIGLLPFVPLIKWSKAKVPNNEL